MDQRLEETFERLAGTTVEPAAVTWVMEYERRQGRQPVDRRHDRSFAADIESPPRLIEIKATATSYRGWFLLMEPVQVKHAHSDPNFYVYVVENVGQGDPALFTVRILSGDQLRQLVEKAKKREYYEVGWPTKNYDATPVESMPGDSGQAPARRG